MRGQARRVAGWVSAAAASYLAVFVLPYRFPLRQPVLSETWIAGSNNLIAAFALALVSIGGTLVCWRRRTQTGEVAALQPLDRRYLLAAIFVATAWTATLGSAVLRSGLYWGDEGYFLNQLQSGLIFHQAIYRQFEFAYGPILYLWPAMFIRVLALVGISFTTAYLISLTLLQALGLALLFYTLRALPLRRMLKTFAFLLLSLVSLNSLLGLNYSLFRFILPFAAVVLLARQKTWSRAATIAGIGEFAMLAVSPELGLAFAGASMAVAAHRAHARGVRWLLVGLAALAGAALFTIRAGPDYFEALGGMAEGRYNLLLTPAPHILVLLIAAVALAPLAVARMLRENETLAALSLGFYAAALGLLPAALGRCDPIHVFCNGIGFYLLAFVTLDQASSRRRNAYLIALTSALMLSQVKNFTLYRERFALILHPDSARRDLGFDEQKMFAAVGGASVSTPLLAPQRVIDHLTRSGQYVPGYFCGWVGVWDNSAEQRKVSDMRKARFALVALSDPLLSDSEANLRMIRWMHFGLADHPLHPPFVRGALLTAELKSHWKSLGLYGDYVLFERLS